MKIRFIILFFLFSYTVIFAQVWPGLNFLLTQPSPLFNGAGELGTAVPMQDPIGYYYNPAQLGYYSQNNNVSIFFMPGNTVLNNQVPFKSTSDSYGITAGYNFKNDSNNFPLSIGVGYLHNNVDYSGYNFISGYHDLYDCLSIGAGYDNYLIYNLGFSVKSFTSFIGSNKSDCLSASGVAFDFGAMIIVPFDKLYLNNTQFCIADEIVKPIFKVSTGYSISNIGESIYYVEPTQSYPLPRTARLGYNINLGLKMNIAGTELPIIDYSFTAEADNLLFRRDNVGNISYKGPLGDINIGNNLFQLKGNNNVAIHKGNIFNFFQTLIIYFGSFSGQNYYKTLDFGNLSIQNYSNFNSNGLAISTKGLFLILGNNSSNSIINYFFKHVCIEYYSSELSANPGYYPKSNGMALYFKGITI